MNRQGEMPYGSRDNRRQQQLADDPSPVSMTRVPLSGDYIRLGGNVLRVSVESNDLTDSYVCRVAAATA